MTNPTKKRRGALTPLTPLQRKSLGEALQQTRIEQDVTQRELADVVGYRNQANISHIETGLKGMPRPKLVLAARYLGVRVESLIPPGDAA